MSPESLSAFDGAIADLVSARAVVEPCGPSVTRSTVRELFAQPAKTRSDVSPNPNSPAATADALVRYFAGHGTNMRSDAERGLSAYRAFYDVLPATWEEMSKPIDQPYETDAAADSLEASDH